MSASWYWTPLSSKPYILTSPHCGFGADSTNYLRCCLPAAVLILPQIKLNSQLLSCTSLFQSTQASGPVGFDYRTSTGLGATETPVLEGTNKILPAPRSRGKEQWPHRRLNQNSLLMLEGLLRRQGHWQQWLGRSPLEFTTYHKAGQTATSEGVQPYPSADNWIKALLSKALPTRARFSFSHSQSPPSGSLHKPFSLTDQRADRIRKTNHYPTAAKTITILQKVTHYEKAQLCSRWRDKIKPQKNN